MIFDPTQYSVAENEFIKAHIHEAPVVAMRALPVQGVNPRAVKPVFDKVMELNQLQAADPTLTWKGPEVIIDAIDTWFAQNAKWRKDVLRGAPRYPSLNSFTSKGRPMRGGPGSDNGLIKTYFRPDGSRAEFAVSLTDEGSATWVPEWIDRAVAEPEKQAPKPVKLSLTVNAEANRIECDICGHAESFNPESRQSYNSARARISKHLRKATIQADEHKELHTMEFRS